ncbi:MAG: sn-glycerol-3-phosphate ABC transporter ATP-binding protein UgpC [Candidatus Tectomicrobia bacterium]|uniref:Sn-glycerol-3-phosphate ABC transporter ATP-binding protein UgpC n=1 Tax=Tectimicrobiota bacterium TaxID=2528274 RepID=A0A938B4T6_UNCTE|nr:sn-glycerol-3-phosphate ABC transporter ATP-binding protein UgpC [Candidatus Tectomicrobia bacterium]
MAQVTLRNLVKKFSEDVIAVNSVNLDIQDKEFVVLVGPSGCGKTTTLRMVAGLEDISEGEIFIGDRLVNDVPPKDRNIAMVFQNYALYPHMTVYKNMAFSLKLRRTPRDEIDRRVKAAADILGIADLLDRKPKQLSGGQRQRVAVGRAIVRQPEVFLFDEPLSNLDAKLRVNMRAELIKLHDRLDATMIYVTHDQVEAMTMGDRIVVMRNGFIQQVGPPMEVYNQPQNQFVAGFIGSPPMNFLSTRLVPNNGGLAVELQGMHLPLPPALAKTAAAYANKPVLFGIRPEDISAEQDNKSSHMAALRTTIEVLEPLGAEVVMELSYKGHAFTARMGPQVQAKMHDEIDVYLNMERVHLFDTQTEQAIR